MKQITFLSVNCVMAPPTKKHKPAVWENMLGTVYAMSEKGDTKYFDYDHKAALQFAGIVDWRNIQVDFTCRLSKFKGGQNFTGSVEKEPKVGQPVLWVERG